MKKDSDALNPEQIMLVQKHQLDQSQKKLEEVSSKLESMAGTAAEADALLDDILAQLDAGLLGDGIQEIDYEELTAEITLIADSDNTHVRLKSTPVAFLDLIDSHDAQDWETYQESAKAYAERNSLDLSGDPFDRLLSDSQRIAIEKRIKDEFTLKSASCDSYDYMIAATCGLIGGLIDVVFVGTPGEGKLTKLSDEFVDNSVERFAKICGWQGGKEGSDSTKSAIGFLERKFVVNYDQATTYGKNGTEGTVNNLSPRNHHVKSLAHSPDLIGLFFSVLNQFTNTSTFVSDGKIISIDTETYELRGSNIISKVFAGFVNWLGHLFSDAAGSSGASTRGSGIPIPFYSMLLMVNVGNFGQHRQTFSKVAVQVFEQGYDFRHGIAMAVPVMVSELLTRIMHMVKQRMFHDKDWAECIPVGTNPELRRMLLVAHGSLCLVDGVDAGLRSGGNVVAFMLRANILAWSRFGTLALKEVRVMYMAGSLDHDAIDEHIDNELKRMLKA